VLILYGTHSDEHQSGHFESEVISSVRYSAYVYCHCDCTAYKGGGVGGRLAYRAEGEYDGCNSSEMMTGVNARSIVQFTNTIFVIHSEIFLPT